MFDLKDRVAIVTGAASGIGLATAEAFLNKGAKVVLADYNKAGGEAVEKDFKDKGFTVQFIETDTTSEDSVKHLVEETVKLFGKLDIIVNSAGIAIITPTDDVSYEEYKTTIAVNQHGVFLGCKYAINEMKKTGGGSIVNLASILGHVGQPWLLAYNASKGAVNIMTKCLALEYAEHNIRVNAVCPGYVDSGMVNKEHLGEDLYDTLVPLHPIGRLGKPEEIAHAIVFLCENEFTTGTSLIVDGGYTAK